MIDPHSESPFPQDEELTRTELAQFDLFAPVREQIDPDRYLPQIVLRTVPPQTVVCPREGGQEVACYLATWEEVLRLKLGQLEAAESTYERLLTRPQHDPEASGELQQWIEYLSGVVSQLEGRAWSENEREKRGEFPAPVARAALPADTTIDAPRPPGLLTKFSRLWGAKSDAPARQKPAPQIEFYEGELVDPRCLPRGEGGEMPNIECTSSCFVLELPQPFVDELLKLPDFREAANAIYRRRVLPGLLHKLPMFSSLEPEAAARLAERAELLTADPGAVICDQHEPADALFLVRSGTVNVVNNASALIDVREIADWKGLCSALLAGEQAMGTSSAP